MPARQYLLQALPVALEALNVYSEAEREGYVTVTHSAHATVVRVRVRSIHLIADRNCLIIPDKPKLGLYASAKRGAQRGFSRRFGSQDLPLHAL